MQLKSAMLQSEILKNKIEQMKLSYYLKLPDSVPVSIIAREFKEKLNKIEDVIENETEINQIFFVAINQIYKKYIDEMTAELEVNISFRCRQNIYAIFENESIGKNVDNTMPLIEKSVIEISGLLNDSRNKFRQKTVFSELAIHIVNSESVVDLINART